MVEPPITTTPGGVLDGVAGLIMMPPPEGADTTWPLVVNAPPGVRVDEPKRKFDFPAWVSVSDPMTTPGRFEDVAAWEPLDPLEVAPIETGETETGPDEVGGKLVPDG